MGNLYQAIIYLDASLESKTQTLSSVSSEINNCYCAPQVDIINAYHKTMFDLQLPVILFSQNHQLIIGTSSDEFCMLTIFLSALIVICKHINIKYGARNLSYPCLMGR
jgi:hypothetical protein